jgi:hypothetical protein
MILKSLSLPRIYQALFICDAFAVTLFFYAKGFPTLGGVLLLSGLLVFVVTLVKSGALSTSWLARQNRLSIGNAVWLELAKTGVCAGLAIDALFGGGRLLAIFGLWRDNATIAALLSVAAFLAIGAGLFLTRAFAAYLLAER